MALTITEGIPSVLTVGDAASFTVSDIDHPTTIWTATKILFKNGANPVRSFDATISGGLFLFTLTNANTATLFAGTNSVCLTFSDGTYRQSSDWVNVEVLPNPTAIDAPSFAQQQVTLLQVVIAKFSATDRRSVNSNGQSFERAAIADYQKQLTYYQAVVIREKRASDLQRGICSPTSAPIEFANR